MAGFVFNIAKGKVGYYAGLPAANDALIAIPLETSGLETDAVLKDKDDFAAVVSGTTNEQTSTMSRKTLASVAWAVDDTNDWGWLDFNDIVWTTPAAGNACSKLVIVYDPDTTGGTDADLIPLICLDFAVTPSGLTITYVVDAAGVFHAV